MVVLAVSFIEVCTKISDYHSGEYKSFKDLHQHMVNKCGKNPQDILFVYLGNKEIYCIFNTCCLISYFQQNALDFIILCFSSNIACVLHHVLKFKYSSW